MSMPPMPPEVGMMAPRTMMVTTLKTKIVQTLEYTMMCKTDEEALNGWRSMCGHGFALVSIIVSDGLLPESNDLVDWKARVKLIFEKFDKLESHGKTDMKRRTVGDVTVYGAAFDGFVSEAEPQDLPFMLDSMNRDKYNRITTNMMKFWGYCESVILASGVMTLDGELEIPISMNRPYSERDIMAGLGDGLKVKGPDKPRPPRV